ncbi:TIGR00269 family protein [Halobacteriales archaeon QS_4_69_34]|nr:MAG: TIGR00269 family protein [Halobacteriales archaeon QS_4_69_34]
MDCTKCGREAVVHTAYSGAHLCGRHLRRSVERRVRRRVREDGLVGDATPEEPTTWLLGLSGGKDSAVLASVLHDTFEHDPRIELVALTVHEGIAGYRDASAEAAVELADDLGIRHELVSYAEEFDLRMDEVVEDDPEGMAPCAYCGVFRRDLLAGYAAEFDAGLLLTGHNLDDEAQTALMNLFEGDVAQIAKHFDASLGPLEERGADDRTDDVASPDATGGSSEVTGDPANAASDTPDADASEAFVPRAKPLRDVPEREVALYAHLADLPVHFAECPHASEAYRGEIQELLYGLEDDHPGTRHSIMAGYEELAAMAAERYRGGGSDLGECERCGSATTRETCRTCQLVESVHAA